MFIDSRKVSGTEFKDGIVIIGCGAAGITLALELEDRGIPVSILESGGMKQEQPNQDLARGDITGRIYYALDNSRLRFYGGCTNHWAGLCRPMDALDFSKRDWVPESGWPFDLAHLAPFYDRARPYLGLKPFAGVDQTYKTFPGLTDAETEFELDYEQFAPRLRIAKEYRARIKKSKLIKIYLYANLTEIATDDSDKVTEVTARTLPGYGDRTLKFRGDTFILAAGGIENARLLLLTAAGRRAALGNRSDHLGRYFMEHLHAVGGVLAIHRPDFPYRPYERLNYHKGFLRLRDEEQRQHQVLNCRMILEEAGQVDSGPLSESVFEVSAMMDGENKTRPRLMHVKFIAEQSPYRGSYVTLSDKMTDALGQPRVALHWEVADIDKKTIDVNLERLARAMGREGHGRMQIRAGSQAEWKFNFLAGGNHHMGTTRMTTAARTGVVNPDGRLFDVPNFYVAGSSVFPNTGHANPTFTILALAIRLADHLSGKMKPVALGNSNSTAGGAIR